MTIWLQLARVAAAANVVLLLVMGGVWLRNYRTHGAKHTLALLLFASFLLFENALWIALYVFHAGFIGWFENAGLDVQVGVMALCALELVALVFIARITWA